MLVEQGNQDISISRQCELLGLSRSAAYYKPCSESAINLELMRQIDEEYTDKPFYGVRRMTHVLKQKGYEVNHKRVARLMQLMGIQGVHPKRNLSKKAQGHKVYPYLLNGLDIDRPNFVWATDITYIPMKNGFIYLTAVMDWYSRYVLAWEVSISLEADFCVSALQKALSMAKPEIFNSDQGSQFTSDEFTQVLKSSGVQISMDGKGRVFDNIFIERLWRSVKYEEVYLHDYDSVREAVAGLARYFTLYNTKRPHQSLGYLTPEQVYQGVQIGNAL